MTKLVHDSQYERYCQARLIYDQRIGYWNEKDDEAFNIFTQLADEGYGKAYYPLSQLYISKLYIKEGEYQALHSEHQVLHVEHQVLHFQQLAFAWCYANKNNHDPELCGDLGDMHLYEDVEQAAFWLHKAAEHGCAAAQHNLSHSYQFGIGVPQSDKEAEKWCRLAADQGLGIAQSNLRSREWGLIDKHIEDQRKQIRQLLEEWELIDKHTEDQKEQIWQWLEENVQSYPTPHTVTLSAFEVDWGNLYGSFRVGLDSVQLLKRFSFSVPETGKAEYYLPRFDCPLRSPDSYAAIILTEQTKTSILEGLHDTIPRIRAHGIDRETGKEIYYHTPVSARITDRGQFDAARKRVEAGGYSVKIIVGRPS